MILNFSMRETCPKCGEPLCSTCGECRECQSEWGCPDCDTELDWPDDEA